MSDMHEATAAGIRELKALLSAALMIAQARERTRERDLRDQERALAQREREARRRDGAEQRLSPHQSAERATGRNTTPGSGYGQDWWELSPTSDEADQKAGDRTGLGGDLPPNVAVRELRDLAEAGELLSMARDAQQRHQRTGEVPRRGQHPPKRAAATDLAEAWANAQVAPDGGDNDWTQLDEQVRARGVDPDEIRDASTILLPPRAGQESAGQSLTPPDIDPEQVRHDADTRAGELEHDPDARRLEAEDTREQALGEVAAQQEDAAAERAPEHPNGAWQGGGRAAQLAGRLYTSDPSSGIPRRLAPSRKQPIAHRDQARTQSRDR